MKPARLIAEGMALLVLAVLIAWYFWPKSPPAPAHSATVSIRQKRTVPTSLSPSPISVEKPAVAPVNKSSNPLEWNWNFKRKPQSTADESPAWQDPSKWTPSYTGDLAKEFTSTRAANMNYLQNSTEQPPSVPANAAHRFDLGLEPKKQNQTDFGLLSLKEDVPMQLQLFDGFPCTITAHQGANGLIHVQLMAVVENWKTTRLTTELIFAVVPGETVDTEPLAGDQIVNFSVQMQ